MPNVFLLYAENDRARIKELRQSLESEGYDVSEDTSLVAGDHVAAAVLRQIERAGKVVVALSSETAGEYVKEQAWRALRRNKEIYPVLLDEGGTDNFVWPLVADRAAIRISGPQDVEAVARLIAESREMVR